MRIRIAALALAFLAPAGAWSDELGGLGGRMAEAQRAAAAAKAGVAAAQEKAAAQRKDDALERTLTAMNDGIPAGQIAVDALREARIEVRIGKQAEPAKVVAGARGERSLVLSDALPKYPRVLAPYIAREAMRVKLAGMPGCAEKEYMVRSVEARVFIELGGDAKGLPVIEPLIRHADAALAAEMKPWLENKAEMALYLIGQETGREILPVLEGRAPKDQREAYQRANKDFVDFLLAENDWRLSYQR